MNFINLLIKNQSPQIPRGWQISRAELYPKTIAGRLY